jgi:hypothetical protein
VGRLATAAGSRLRRLQVGLAVAVVGVLGLGLSGCGGGGLSLARQACVHVDASIRLYDESEHADGTKAAGRDLEQAGQQLATALPLAARATSADPQWNPLMTTLEEVDRNHEGNLVQALRSQCAMANSSGEQAPVIVPTTSGDTTVPTPTTLPGQ